MSRNFTHYFAIELQFYPRGATPEGENLCPRGLCRFDLSKGQVNQQKFVLGVKTLSFSPAEGCKVCPRGMDIDWGMSFCFNLYWWGKALS